MFNALNHMWFWEIETISLTIIIIAVHLLLSKGRKKKELRYIKTAQAVAGIYILFYTTVADPSSQVHYSYLAVIILLNIAVHRAEFSLLWQIERDKQNTDS